MIEIDVSTYGKVTPSFRNLVKEILNNVSEDMSGFSPKCRLSISKTKADYQEYVKLETKRVSKILGLPITDSIFSALVLGAQYIDCPEMYIIEDSVKPGIRSLEQLEGDVAHEAGHMLDYYKYGKMSLQINATPFEQCIERMKDEFEAENNALDAGYSSGILSKNIENMKGIIHKKEPISFGGFYYNLSVIPLYVAFMQNKNTPELQKRKAEEIFKKFGESRSVPGRKLFNSPELKEHPEKFAETSFIEDFVFKNHYGWNFSFI